MRAGLANLESPLSGSRRSPQSRSVLLAMGPQDIERDGLWLSSGAVRRVVRLTHAVPSGRRLRSRALGLGVDSALLALKALAAAFPGPYLAANPWTAVALRMLGSRPLAVTGLYAVPGTPSFRALLRVLRRTPLVTSSAIEAAHWNAAGGRAVAVRYGNTFGYPLRTPRDDEVIRVFVGGTSDRDSGLVAVLENEVRASSAQVRLTVVDASAPSHWSSGQAAIRHTGVVTAETFGRLLADSDVVVLPLAERQRAAGQMVLVGALEVGAPVLTTPTQGIREYIDEMWVRTLDRGAPLLPQVLALADETHAAGRDIRDHWRTHFSLDAYVQQVTAALAALTVEAHENVPARVGCRSPRRRGA